MATPFVQGRLRGEPLMTQRGTNEPLAVEIESECKHCGRSLHLTVDSDLRWSVGEDDAKPLVFEPQVDWQQFTAPNIIHDY